jgi:hypothetical protein
VLGLVKIGSSVERRLGMPRYQLFPQLDGPYFDETHMTASLCAELLPGDRQTYFSVCLSGFLPLTAVRGAPGAIRCILDDDI